MNIKQKLLLMSVILLITITGILSASDLIITGVVDGPLTGGVPKAIELYVVNNIPNLNIYGIGSANNGGGTDGEEFNFPSMAASAGTFLYVASETDGFNNYFGFSPRFVNSAASINGDDAIELFKDGNVVDIFGDINVDGSGEAWEYLDGWVYRKDNTGPDGSNFIMANWTFSGVDALDGETTNATASNPFPLGTYTSSSGGTAPLITDIAQTPLLVTSSDEVSISATIKDDGTIAKANLFWGTSAEVYSDSITMVTTDDSIFVTENPIPTHAHGTTVYYKVEAKDNDYERSASVDLYYTVLDYDPEPTKYVTNFIATKVGTDKIILSWHEDDGSVAPDGYLIKASTSDDITNPVDGTPTDDNIVIGDNSGTINVPHGRISYEWTDLTPETTYYFNIYPYSNSDDLIDYKTDSNIPKSENTTNSTSLITEYYSETTDLSGEVLKEKLNDIISNHIEYPYTDSDIDTWDILKVSDKDTLNPNNVLLIYKGTSVDAAQEYYNGAGWTREHVWAQSHGDFDAYDNYGPGTDTHHLRPSDGSVNSTKLNLDFDNGGTQHTEATECFYDDDSWEVRDAVKGDIARMMFYMDTRYEGENGDLDLKLVDYIPSSPNKEPYHGKLSTLIEWHKQDPVDAYERKRNEVIYSFQGNRNPYIDHPEFVSLIWEETPDGIEEQLQTALTYNLSAAYPNPFNPSTTISYEIPQHCIVTLNIFNIQGKLINTLVNESQNSGNYKVVWNGLDKNNLQVGTGVYIYQMSTNSGFSKTAKVVFLK